MVAALAAPRLARAVAGRACFVDAAYLDAAVRIAHGGRPYRDFLHPQAPLPELLLGAAYRTFGTSCRVPMALTAVLAFIASLLVFRVGRRAAGTACGVVAALLFAFHPEIWRLNVFSHELFVLPPLLAALELAAVDRAPSGRRLAAIAGLAAVATASKLTFVVAAPAVVLSVPHPLRRWRDSLRVAVALLLGVAGALLACRLWGGPGFTVQAVAFHLAKGRAAPAWRYCAELLLYAPLMLPLALAAVALAFRHASGPVVWLALEIAYLALVAPVVWEHDLLPLLAAACVVLAVAVVSARERISRARRSALSMGAALAACAVVATAVAFAVVSGGAGLLAPLRDPGWSGASTADLEAVAAAIDRVTSPQTLIVAPPEVAVEADRRTPVHSPETDGLELELSEAAAHGALWSTVRADRRLGFLALMARSRAAWRPRVSAALGTAALPLIVIDWRIGASPLAALGSVTVSAGALARNGYAPSGAYGDYSIYLRAAARTPFDRRGRGGP